MSESASRAERLVAGLEAQGVDAMLVTFDPNLAYLTGYSGDNGVAVIGPRGARLVTDGRYATSAREEVRGAEVVIGERDLREAIGVAIAELAPAGRVGVESEHVTLARFERLRAVAGDATLVPVADLVEDLRVVKDDDELARIRRAAEVADRALERVLAGGVVGRREADVATDVVATMIDEGAEGASFDPIVASGPRGALPHAMPSREPILADTLVTFDLGARVDGYCSDMTRTFSTGTPPDALRAAYAACARAHRLALEAVRPGVSGAELDKIARGVITEAGLGEHFVHGLGHGVGVQIHERPGIRRTGTEVLRPGMVITVEPGVYLEGLGGVRIEDLVLVTDDGHRVLSGFPHGAGDEPPMTARG